MNEITVTKSSLDEDIRITDVSEDEPDQEAEGLKLNASLEEMRDDYEEALENYNKAKDFYFRRTFWLGLFVGMNATSFIYILVNDLLKWYLRNHL